jgi:valyl-tRNA synthetase
MPFITEELWKVTAEGGVAREELLTLSPWPLLAGLHDEAAEAEIGWVIDLVNAIRSVRAEMNIPPALQIPLVLVTAAEAPAAEATRAQATRERAARWADMIKRLARVGDISFAEAPPQGAVQLLVRGDVAALPLKGVIDIGAEKSRLEKELARVAADIARVDAKLGNADFVARAPEEVVEGEREKRDEAMARQGKINEALERLKSVA